MTSPAPEIAPDVPPSGRGCVECLDDAPLGWWLHLRRCAACGHVGCCDNSATGSSLYEVATYIVRSGALIDSPGDPASVRKRSGPRDRLRPVDSAEP
jgi:hypothetical protein